MTYRSLLLHLDNDPLCIPRTEVAIRLAAELDCHLAGVAPTGLIEVPMAIGADASIGAFAAMAADALRDEAQQVVQRFRDRCRDAGVKSFEAVIDECDKAQSLVRHVHCSDLAILTQADPKSTTHRTAQAMIEKVVLNSARPTLMLPYAGPVKQLGRCVMVAWDDSRESARAVSDALPLLQRAGRVEVLAWNEPRAQKEASLASRLDALQHWLLWHGVSTDVRVETMEIDIADAMLSRAADLAADLVVMGAYGHARWTERVLGGATRGLLASMSVPVLMSH